jgi:hypothetical protein
MARTQREVPIEHRGMWTVPDLAAYLGLSDQWIYNRIVWDADDSNGTLSLPGRINVPVHRDVNRYAFVYRRQLEAAIDQAPIVHVHAWTGTATADAPP